MNAWQQGLPSLSWAGLAKRKLLLFFQHLRLRLKILFDQCQPTPFFGGLGYFTRRYFGFEKRRSVGRISAVLSPIWLKFWPKVGLASLLDCYSMKKSGCLLKKRSFRRFPSLGGNGKSLRAYALGKMWPKDHFKVIACLNSTWKSREHVGGIHKYEGWPQSGVSVKEGPSAVSRSF